MKHQSKNKRRLFFAVWPDTKTLTALLDAQNSISAMKARPVPTENLHITLVFIGSASKETERCLVDATSGLSGRSWGNPDLPYAFMTTACSHILQA